MVSPKKPKLAKTDNGKKSAASTEPPSPRFGPMPRISNHRIWSRGIVIIGVLIYVWYTSKDTREIALAKQKEFLPNRGQNVDCDREYLDEIQKYLGCVPKQCGRYVSDKIVTAKEAEILLSLAKRGIETAGGSGGASILDLHSGALSSEDKFVNIYKTDRKIVEKIELDVYSIVKNKIRKAIAQNFGIEESFLHLTHPTFFSRLTNKEPVTPHDEYWHIHIDKETYEAFHYTSLLYLNDYSVDFQGGRFLFVDASGLKNKNVTVEPRKGRISMFTSGAENPHFVERVLEGERYAITVSFTCDRKKAIKDPIV